MPSQVQTDAKEALMRAVIVPAIAVLALLPLPAATAGGESPQTTVRKCKPVPFTPNSDDAASAIRARGLTCGLARDFIRDSEGRPGARFRGFRCAATAVDGDFLPYTAYRCRGAGDVIRWKRY